MNEQLSNPGIRLYLTGTLLCIASTLLFCLPDLIHIQDNGYFGLFGVNYAITVTYGILLLIAGKFKRDRGGLPYIFLLLVLFLISAYSLNRSVSVFEISVNWMCIVLVIISVNAAAIFFFNTFPSWLKHLCCLILGVSMAVFIYLAIYLLPIYPISVLLLLGLLFSAHAFLPILFALFTGKFIRRVVQKDKRYAWSFSAGILLCITIIVTFIVQWSSLNEKVNSIFQHSLIAENTDLPAWIKVSRELPDTWVTEKYLKSELVYSIPQKWNEGSFWGFPSQNFDEVRKHDPLVMMAYLFSPKPQINESERIKVLESMYDSRHKTQERLWSGENLRTQHVISNIRIWPDLRMAYTEKTITVLNDQDVRGWQNRQEGIYTFHLPEGGVVTSLSLWINGKEEKGLLTTKSKADSAYRTIVGVESRDPSVVHWQEGNTVSVRVFPVLKGENRVFKIGITAPLELTNNRLVYNNIWFDGPDAGSANETIQIDWAQKPVLPEMPSGFEEGRERKYTRETSYQATWSLSCKDNGISNNAFHFDQHTYSLLPYKKVRVPFACNTIYLDINQEWTPAEMEQVYAEVKGKKIFVYDDALIEVTESNKKDLFRRLQERRFSLFPLFEIKDPSTSLLISKNPWNGPNMKDLKGTDFAKRLESKLNKEQRIKLFNLGTNLSPYLKTLKEHRVFDYEQGDVSLLRKVLSATMFAQSIEDEEHIVIDNAALIIQRTNDSVTTNAPDHLMRLFAYNHIMHKLQHGVFSNQEINDTLVQEASQAYIVSPISSLVVLETQADYEKFNIAKSKNSLDNASLKSKGAVPEPHEWALIIVALCIAGWLFYQNKTRIQTGI